MQWRTIARAKGIIRQEEGVVVKEWGGRLRVLFTYPDTYFTGMSNLALHLFYGMLNDMPDVVCERAFWEPSLANEPLISLESQRRPQEFDIWAFTFSFEMDYTNVPFLLRQAGVPLWAEERDESWPLLIAGGPAISANPEPLAPFFDAIVIGEGEETLADSLIPLWQEMRGAPRREVLEAMHRIPGVYVPLLHSEGSPAVKRLWVRDLTRFPTANFLHTTNTEFGGLHQIEIARGCGRGCRFCMAGYIYRPPRQVPLESVLAWVEEGLRFRKRIGLVSPAVSDYLWIDDLALQMRQRGAEISVSSLRADSLSETLVKAVAESGTRTLTVAPEAGSERLRRVINKPQSDEDLLRAVEWAGKYRLRSLKLYFMVGHPTETEKDIEAIVEFVRRARSIFRRNIAINATPFVPKPHTPFQWEAMASTEVIRERQEYLRKALAPMRVKVRGERPELSALQGILARGDRRLAPVMASMKKPGARAFRNALEAAGLAPEEFLRQREMDEHLPWDVVDSGVRPSFLKLELRRARAGKAGHHCPADARGCLECGVCPMDWAFPEKAKNGRASMA